MHTSLETSRFLVLLLPDGWNSKIDMVNEFAEMESHPYPTKRNMQEALRWLVKDNQDGDSLVFYFSGHGLNQPNPSEYDGFNETICPIDYMTAGMIIDDEINDTIVRPLKKGVKLHAIIDSCHSGTVLDLPYAYSTKEYSRPLIVKYRWLNMNPPYGVYKGTSGGLAISICACQDNQFALATSALSESGKQMESVMTYTFRKALLENSRVTYANLLASMHNDIWVTSQHGIFRRERPQEPLLSSSEVFDLNEQFVL
ncbi:hypothetical protein L1887_40044 [Cichorium endivia]|nr:hypothetical protein L1887_40044 [Cichorium endivia]